MERFRKRLDDIPLKKKIALLLFVVDFLLIGLCAAVALRLVQRHSNELLYQTMEQSMVNSAAQIEYVLDDEERILSALTTDSILQQQIRLLKDTQGRNAPIRSEAFRQIGNALQSYAGQFVNGDVDCISLYSTWMDVHTNTVHAQAIPEETRAALLQAALDGDGRTVWFHDGTGSYLTALVRQIEPFTLDPVGTIVIRLRLDHIVERSVHFGNTDTENYCLLSDASGQQLYASPDLPAGLLQASFTGPGYQILPAEGHRYFVVTGALPDHGWSYTGIVLYDSVFRTQRTVALLYALTILLSFILAAFFTNLLLGRITRHFERLIEKMKRFGENEATLLPRDPSYACRKDEIGVLHRQFDHMADQIVDLIRRDYKNQLLRKDAQLRALESQIDPHFLYNVLASINWRAKAIGETQISQMVESLSALLRSTLSKNDGPFTLAKELALVRHYAQIQKIRFDDQLLFSVDAPSDLDDALIPKMTVQPLVENAIRYGMQESTDPCTVQVQVRHCGDALTIQVRNTGTRFPENMADQLIAGTLPHHGFGIGLANIQQRIQLTFGEECRLQFANETGWAVVSLTIPYRPYQEENRSHVENADCR